MKTICVALAIAFLSAVAVAADGPLIPDGVNQILGRIKPDMPETDVQKLVHKYYPKAKIHRSVWSGQTGYVEFKLTDRFSVSVAEYNDPKDHKSRFVHADMILYVYDWKLKQRINISFHKWDEDKKDGGKTSEQPDAEVQSEGAPSD